MPLTFTPATILPVSIQHLPDCSERSKPDHLVDPCYCDCPGETPRCSADGEVVHIFHTTAQNAYCDGWPRHAWQYCETEYVEHGRATGHAGSYWRQVS